MDINVENTTECSICHLSGELDYDNVNELNECLEPYLEKGDEPLEIDFANLRFLSAAGLEALMTMAYELNVAQRSYRLTGLSDSGFYLINMSGLQRILPGDRPFHA